ncbi:MAG: c-type cytochrome domain-containing protein [Planctomycetota bacterium]
MAALFPSKRNSRETLATHKSGAGLLRPFCSVVPLLLLGWGSVPRSAHAEPNADYEREVRPIFVQRCIQCHGPTKQSGGLRLDGIESIRTGGDSGPAVQNEKPEASLLLRAVRQEDDVSAMPPEGEALSTEIAFDSVDRGWPAGNGWRCLEKGVE